MAGSLLLQFGQTVFYAFTGCAPDDFCLHPHDILQIEAIRSACKNGFRWYDFGEVTEDHEALAQFKTKWGGDPKQLYRYYYPAPVARSSADGGRLRSRSENLATSLTEGNGSSRGFHLSSHVALRIRDLWRFPMPNDEKQETPVRLAYIGCWYKNDMYSHNCSNLVDSLRTAGMKVDVVTSNCRCFSSAQKFTIAKDELINTKCSPVAIPHAPRQPGKKHGMLKYLAVKVLRLDLIFATARGFLYYKRARHADVIHFDHVLKPSVVYLFSSYRTLPAVSASGSSSQYTRSIPFRKNTSGSIVCTTNALKCWYLART